MGKLSGKTVAILTENGFEEVELTSPKKALEDAGASIAESVMIGDNVEADILGAMEIGMRAILFNYYEEPCLVDCPQVLKMKEIEAYL